MSSNVAKLLSTMVFFTALIGSAPTYAGPMRFGCDTATGRFSPVTFPLTTSQLTFTGTIKPVLFRKDPKWLPTAFVRVEDNNKQSITIRLTAENSKAEAADVKVEIRNGDDKSSAAAGTVPLESVLPFSISYGENDDVAITVDGKKLSVPKRLGDKLTLSLICSTGDFIFEEIEWSSSDTK